jgi:TP901 family phage tail tape measure protein
MSTQEIQFGVTLRLRLDQYLSGLRQAAGAHRGAVDQISSQTARASRSLASAGGDGRILVQSLADAAGQALGLAAALSGIVLPVKAAIEFEAAMADVKKVVDFEEPTGLAQLSDDLLLMSRRIPLAATALAQITAAGGQMGIAERDLTRFTEIVAKLAVALDLPADAAGESMGKIANIFHMTMDQMEELGDAINHLSNNSASKASEIINALRRIGGVANQFGLTAEQASALSATLISLGQAPEIAGTAINAMLQKLQNATAGSKKFKEALKELRIDAGQLEESIRKDAQAALLDFFEAIENVDKSKRGGLLTNLFGMEHSDTISILVGAMDEYRNELDLVADRTKYLGSAQKEFEAKAATTKNEIQLLGNAVSELGIRIGNTLLAPLGDATKFLRNLTASISDFVYKHPEMTQAITYLSGALVGLTGVMGAARLAALALGVTLPALGVAVAGVTYVAGAIGLVGSMVEAADATKEVEKRAIRANEAYAGLALAADDARRAVADTALLPGLSDDDLVHAREMVRLKLQAIEGERQRLELEQQRPIAGYFTDHSDEIARLAAEEKEYLAVAQAVGLELAKRPALATAAGNATQGAASATAQATAEIKKQYADLTRQRENATSKVAEAEKALAAEQTRLTREVLNNKISTIKKEISERERAIDESIRAEERLAKRIADLQDSRRRAALDTDGMIRDVRRRGMTDRQKEADVEQEIAEKINRAKQLASSGSQSDRRLAEDQARDAQRLAAGLKDAGTAISGIKAAGQVLDDIHSAQEAVARQEYGKQRQETASLADQMERAKKEVQELKRFLEEIPKEQTKEIELKADAAHAKQELDSVNAKLEELQINAEKAGVSLAALGKSKPGGAPEDEHLFDSLVKEVEQKPVKVQVDTSEMKEGIDNTIEPYAIKGFKMPVGMDPAKFQEGLKWLEEELKRKNIKIPATLDVRNDAPTKSVGRFASGGLISGPGGPTDDSIFAALSNGEYVLPAAQTRVALPLLEWMRGASPPVLQDWVKHLPKFAQGGIVSNLRLPDLPALRTIRSASIPETGVMRIELTLPGAAKPLPLWAEQSTAETLRRELARLARGR